MQVSSIGAGRYVAARAVTTERAFFLAGVMLRFYRKAGGRGNGKPGPREPPTGMVTEP